MAHIHQIGKMEQCIFTKLGKWNCAYSPVGKVELCIFTKLGKCNFIFTKLGKWNCAYSPNRENVTVHIHLIRKM
jgi:hypothetical protein